MPHIHALIDARSQQAQIQQVSVIQTWKKQTERLEEALPLRHSAVSRAWIHSKPLNPCNQTVLWQRARSLELWQQTGGGVGAPLPVLSALHHRMQLPGGQHLCAALCPNTHLVATSYTHTPRVRQITIYILYTHMYIYIYMYILPRSSSLVNP